MKEYIPDLVTIIIPTYKRSTKLKRAIESVLLQSYDNIELLVVNDNDPNDEFTEILKRSTKEYTVNPKFKLVMQERHINGAVARNVGIKEAKGEYIAFLDDDDWWRSDKIEKQVNKIKELDETWGCISCRIEEYNGNELIHKNPKYKNGLVYKDILKLDADYATGTLLIRHTVLDEIGGFDEKLLRHQDLQLLVAITSKYKLFQLDEFLHCCDVSDTINRPTSQNIISYKKAFFDSISFVIMTLEKKDLRCVECVHCFEIGYVFLKEKNFIKAFQFIFRSFKSIEAISLILKKVLNKIS